MYITLKNFLDGLVRPDNGVLGNVRPYTASYTIGEYGDAGDVFSNLGAAGAVTFTLPTPKNGRILSFQKKAAQNVTVQATNGAKIYGPAGASAANGTFADTTTAETGKYCEMFADGTDWTVTGATGTWVAT